MKIDIWSDIACPFCYIGLTQLKQAIAAFPHAEKLQLVQHSFELDPDAPKVATESMAGMLARKKGMPTEQVDQMLAQVTESAKANGLRFEVDAAKIVNTFDGHRLIHFAAAHDKASEMSDRLYKAYFADGLSVADTETLIQLAGEVGLDEADVRTALTGDTYADAVRADIQLAATYGISGVPFFIFGDKYGVSGAQGVEAFGEVLSKVWHENNPPQMVGANNANACQDGVCL